MYVMKKENAPRREFGGLKSYFLLQPGEGAETNFLVTWVDVPAGASQMKHRHSPEQVYVVISGQGRMHVGDESREIGAGEMAHVPPDTEHYIVNTGDEIMTYLSAATPPFDVAAYYDRAST